MFHRYLTLAHLAAVATPSELATYRIAVAKLLNSLSWQRVLISPQAIDDSGMVLRVDLRDYGWDAGTWQLLEALRARGGRPRLVFASTLAVYGGELPQIITDTHHLTPQTSYGAQKAAGELLVADFSRKGLLDGRSLRLPTIVVRPGDVREKPELVAKLKALGAAVEPMPATGMLGTDPREGAVRIWQKAVADTHLALSLGMAPAPRPWKSTCPVRSPSSCTALKTPSTFASG